MKYALFLGCTVPVRAQNYEISARKIAEKLGIELVDLSEFRCCGYPIKSVNSEASLMMAARNLAIAEEKGLDITTLCNACSVTLVEANHELKANSELLNKVNQELGKEGKKYTGKVAVKHFVRILYEEYGVDKIKEKVVKPLAGVKFAAHYGCHYIRPSEVYEEFDDPEYPVSLDMLIEATGSESVDYPEKQLCCGGGILGIKEEVALALSRKKLDYVKEKEVDGLISICPFCSVMYEGNQKKIEKMFEREYKIPVIYYTQILGLALGIPPEELGFKLNRIKATAFLEKLSNEAAA